MSITTATDRLSPQRVTPRHLLSALLLAIGLTAFVVVIALTSTSTTTTTGARPIGHPARFNQPAPVTNTPSTTLRDPATHQLLTITPSGVDTPPAPPADSTIGHRNNP